MSTSIYIFTNTFPFGEGETFIDNEVTFWDQFDNIYLIPLNNCYRIRYQNFTNKVKIINIPRLSKVHKLSLIINAILKKEFYKELSNIFFFTNKNLPKLRRLLSFMVHGLHTEKYIKTWIRCDKQKNNRIVLYSYWLNENAYSVSLLSKKLHIPGVSRAHRHDIYIEKNPLNYLPLRNFLAQYLYQIYPISRDGESYLKALLPNPNKICLYRLGTKNHGIAPDPSDCNIIRIVSCSWMSKIKRLDRILDALNLIKGKKILYTHIGDGPMMKQLKQKSKHLPPNIQVEFKGALSQTQIFELYKETPFHYFINVSEHEGISVAIMEAMSFGIPVIATDVGASSEIVVDGYNGYLLNAHYTPEQLATIIMSLPYNKQFRENARNYWQNNFNADINYKEFFTHLSLLE